MAGHNGHYEPSKFALAVGFGIGGAWLLMAAWCLYYGLFVGYGNHRTDYGFVWTVVGTFLLGCGIAAIVGTWNHQFRVMKHHH